MATFNNGESGLSVRNKLNTIINKVEGVSTIDNDINVDGVNLSPIAATIADTAVDVFVYDTSKDSDGGAWRKRTQHTSWYNETLNTSTRGSRREFPAVAVIVAESNQVTIYDGDDPDMPMWMVFNALSGANITTAGNVSAIFMMNGLLSVVQNSGGYRETNFIRDTFSYVLTSTDNTAQGVVNRNTANLTVSGGSRRIVNNNVNDVAMTVLPNAPIDAATGLPVPTIAVATDGGVSVIKDDGTVVDSASLTEYLGVSFVKSQYGADLYAVNVQFADDPQWFPNVGGLSDGFASTKNFYANTPAYEKLSSDVLSKQSGNVFAPIAEHTFAVGMATSVGIGLDPALNLVQHSTTLDNDGLVAYINSSHNTGWMNGDIKLATLSDTDATNVTGSELVTNGDFATDSDWTKQTGWAIASGVATFSGTDYNYITQDISTVSGKTYTATFEITAITTGSAQLRIMDGGTELETTIQTAIGTYAVTFVATSTTTTVRVYAGFSGSRFSGSVDNISVRLAEEDRSVNGNGLQVFGTVTKAPVATGAELVAYSGFSASNYLEQPYNSDLDFGTGDFSIITWAKTNGSVNNNQTIFNMGYNSGSTWEYWIALQILGSNGNIRFATAENGVFTTEDAAVDADTGTWTCIAAVRRSGVLEVYKDGTFLSSDSGTVRDLTIDANAKSRIGLQLDGTSASVADDTSIALLRVSATAPTAEQIKKIYEDEKVLFQENAAATLYGSSDAVTALAFDDSTQMLHVGTSAGRSVFQGLRRVSNTTTAVGTAISASNSLVVEE